MQPLKENQKVYWFQNFRWHFVILYLYYTWGSPHMPLLKYLAQVMWSFRGRYQNKIQLPTMVLVNNRKSIIWIVISWVLNQLPLPNFLGGFGYKGLVVFLNDGWLMEKNNWEPTVPKWVLISWPKNTQNAPNIFSPICLPKPKNSG